MRKLLLAIAATVLAAGLLGPSGTALAKKPLNGGHGHGGKKVPTVSITSPADLGTFVSGVPVTFEGTASDAEDGDLTAGLAWVSSIDSDIGNGGNISATPSDGTHTITASVTDSGGKTGSASIRITVWTVPDGAKVVGVVSIVYETVDDKKASVTFTVEVDLGDRVPGAAVTATLFRNGKAKDTDTFITGADGTVTVDGGSGPPGTYTIEINDVDAYGLKWDGVTPPNSFTD